MSSRHRYETIEQLIDLVTVDPRVSWLPDGAIGWPDTNVIPREHIFVGEIFGAGEIPLMKANPLTRDDEWTVTLYVTLGADTNTRRQAVGRYLDVMDAFDQLLADNPKLSISEFAIWPLNWSETTSVVYPVERGWKVSGQFEILWRTRATKGLPS